MRPVSVRFRCFGPYMEEQFIDFTKLEANGLFLICGETGAGKTTILDAICYALYGRSSGALRGDFSVMRCKLADKNDETLVEYIFDAGGKRYQFIRTLKYGRKNLNDTHNCLVQQGEVFVPVFENPKATVVNKKAEELIGLTYEQFRQVIILPQGQFEKLLVSNSEEKEKILVSLFHADRWQRIADEIYRRVAQRDEALRGEKNQIGLKLREYRCENLAQLEAAVAGSREAIASLQAQAETVRQQLECCKKNQEQAILENREFETLARLEGELARLNRQQDHFRKEGEILAAAQGAEAIGSRYFAVREARSQLQRAQAQLEQKQQEKERAKKSLESAENRFQTQQAQHPAQEERSRRLTLLENAREGYGALEEKTQAANLAKQTLKLRENEKKKAETGFRTAEAALQRAVEVQDEAIRTYQQAQKQYLQGIGGVLAQSLEGGQPCPVCGSREHPAPAVPVRGHITEQELDALTRNMNAANDAVTRCRSQRSGAEQLFRSTEAVCQQAVQAEAVAGRDLENAKARLLPGIETAAKLEQAIADLKRQMDAFRKQDAQVTDALNNARNVWAAAEAEARTAGENLTAAEIRLAAAAADWQGALAEAGFATEAEFLACDLQPGEKQRRNEALMGYRADLARTEKQLAEQKSILEGKTAPDLAGVKQALTNAERAYKEITTQLALAENALKRMEADEKDLSGRLQVYEAARAKTDLDLDFANRIRGRSGVSLQRYVLGVMLTSITLQANRLLAGVYGGRYRLYRTDEIAGSARKGGLELEVLDSHMGARRSVTTLSGGEKFLVALSLAIGLSAVVQAQGSGIRLEAMFIDEGFGSLDREAVYDALEVLQGIGGKAGLVGIISHVDALAEAIPAKIEIQKGNRGSKCVIRS